jgi:hypothetical protein
VQLEIDALDSSNCKLAGAQVVLGVPSGLSQAIEYALFLHPFPSPLCTLTVSVQGIGTVLSTPSGIDCGSGNGAACIADFPSTTNLQLTPTTAVRQWMGCDTSTNTTCSLTLSQSKTVSAGF